MSARFMNATNLAFKHGYAHVEVRARLIRTCPSNRSPHIRKRCEYLVDWCDLDQKPKEVQVCPGYSFRVAGFLR